jgi:hypothetical protein
MLISAICPTYARSDRHPLLYEAFRHQDHADSELLVLDDSPEPSSFFLGLDDPRVCYEHLPVRQSIGAKRNTLVARARGEAVVHFDDDDYYAPNYLAGMAEALADDDFVTLGEWHAWQEATATMWRWDTTRVDGVHAHVSRTGYRWIDDMAAHVGGMAAYADVDASGFRMDTAAPCGRAARFRTATTARITSSPGTPVRGGIGAGSCRARRGSVAASTWSTPRARRLCFRRDWFLQRNGDRRWVRMCCGGCEGPPVLMRDRADGVERSRRAAPTPAGPDLQATAPVHEATSRGSGAPLAERPDRAQVVVLRHFRGLGEPEIPPCSASARAPWSAPRDSRALGCTPPCRPRDPSGSAMRAVEACGVRRPRARGKRGTADSP